MATVTTTWTSPASATLDKSTGGTIDEAMTDALAGNFYHLGGTAGYIGCRAYATAPISVATATPSTVPMAGEYFDADPNGAMHDLVTNNDRITVRTTGLYHVGGQAVFNPSGTGYREAALYVNSAPVVLHQCPAIAGINQYLTVYVATTLTAGDYVTLAVQHTHGSALSVSGSLSVIKA
jgi:hypothetical protein